MFYGWTFGSERNRERTTKTGKRGKITLSTATFSHSHTHTHTHTCIYYIYRCFRSEGFLCSLNDILYRPCVCFGNDRRSKCTKGREKMANKNKGVYLIVYIFLSYRRTIKKHEWAIIKMIEDSIFRFNTSHYFVQSFYLLFFSVVF